MFEIPLRNDLPSYRFTIELENELYGFNFYWNTRSAQWFFDMFNEDSEPLISGIPVIVDWNVLGRFTNDIKPKGLLLFNDTTGKKNNPGRHDLGTNVRCFYTESTEL